MDAIRSVEAELVSLDDARFAAMTRNDLSALEPLLADGLSYTHSTGAVESKAQYLDALRGGRVRYRAVRREVDRLTTFEDCAVMQGRLEVQAQVDQQAIVARTVFTSTWVRHEAGWQLAAWAATSQPEGTTPAPIPLHTLTINHGDTP